VNLEGYLYPDTYHFARPSDPDTMVRAMVQRFRSVYNELRAGADPPRELTPHQQVTRWPPWWKKKLECPKNAG
jgi:cell division protein YceG involved in septum cleavage